MGSGRGALRRAVKSTASVVDIVSRPRPGVVVLVYHRVGGGSDLEMDLPVELFEQQIEELAAGGQVVPLAAALDRLLSGSPVGAEVMPIAVTFDDGARDFADVALPVLVRFGIPVTLYASTCNIEEREPFAHGAEPLSWQALSDACSTGLVDVGSHTHTHRLLDRASGAELTEELDRSIELIATRLGRPPLDFAYPKALRARGDNEGAVRLRFRSAALAGTRPNPVGTTDLHRLARSPVQRSDGMKWFRSKARGGLWFEDSLRGAVNRARYARART